MGRTVFIGIAAVVLAGCGPSIEDRWNAWQRAPTPIADEDAADPNAVDTSRLRVALRTSGRTDPGAHPAPGFESGARAELTRRVSAVVVAPFAWHLVGDDLERKLEAFDPLLDVQFRRESDRGAIERVLLGEADVALVAVALSAHERDRGLHERVVAQHAWVLAVAAEQTLRSVTRGQARDLLNGTVTTFATLGGPLGDIRLVVPGTGAAHDHAATTLIPGDRFAGTALRAKTIGDAVEELGRYRTTLAVLPFAVASQRRLRVLAIDTAPAAAPDGSVHPQYPFQTSVRLVARRFDEPRVEPLVDWFAVEIDGSLRGSVTRPR